MVSKKVSQNKAARKTGKKKTTSKKTAPKKRMPEKTATKKRAGNKAMPKKQNAVIILEQEPISTGTINSNCKCKQKKSNGKFFCFRLVQGRWVQASGIPFPTQEMCEEVNCLN
ncbi:MAG: hypothetical protein ABI834_08320 [Ginsengibacter sp.]